MLQAFIRADLTYLNKKKRETVSQIPLFQAVTLFIQQGQ